MISRHGQKWKKSQNSVGFFKIKYHLKCLQNVVKALSAPCSSIFSGTFEYCFILTYFTYNSVISEIYFSLVCFIVVQVFKGNHLKIWQCDFSTSTHSMVWTQPIL